MRIKLSKRDLKFHGNNGKLKKYTLSKGKEICSVNYDRSDKQYIFTKKTLFIWGKV